MIKTIALFTLLLSVSVSVHAQTPQSADNSLQRESLQPNSLLQRTSESTTPFQSYVLNLTKEQLVFLDTPKTLDSTTKSFFYHIVKGDNPTVMQMLHTTANCSTKQLKIDSNTLLSLDPPKVLNYEVVKKGWISLDNNGTDEAIFNYVCFNQIKSGYTLHNPTGQVAVMYYNYLQQLPKK